MSRVASTSYASVACLVALALAAGCGARHDRGEAWAGAAPLAVARSHHTATLLATGKVLVTGGVVDAMGASTTDAELYDPVTGTWSRTGAMATARSGHTATLLSSGEVLVVGGSGAPEVYDTASGTWRATPPLPPPSTLAPGIGCDGASAVLLPSGLALWVSCPFSYFYDPALDRWTYVSSLHKSRNGFTLTLLASGRPLLAGGWGCIQPDYLCSPAGSLPIYETLASTEWFVDGSTSPVPFQGYWGGTGIGLVEARDSHTATLLRDGRVLVAGGQKRPPWRYPVTPTTLGSAELLDVGAATSTATGPMSTARTAHTATLLGSGDVLVVGGRDPSSGAGGETASAEVFVPAAGSWAVAPPMPEPRAFHTATLLPSGQVLVVGGEASGQPLASTRLYRQ